MFAFLVVGGVAYAQGPPVVESVGVTSDPGDDGGYGIGDAIEIGVTFSEEVRASGSPQIVLDIGGDRKMAVYSGTGTRQLLFSYTVEEGVEDADGFEVVANSLDRNGGTIQSTDDSTGAALGHPALQAGDGHVVDGIAPEVEVIFPEAQNVDPTRVVFVNLVFTESVFDLTIDDIAVTNGTAHNLAAFVAFRGQPRLSRWKFFVLPQADGPVTVRVPDATAEDTYGNGNDPSTTGTFLAADPVDVEIALSTSGLAEGQAAEFVLSRSRDNGEIPVSVSVDESGDFASGTVEIARASDPDNPLEVTFDGIPATIEVTFEAGELSKRIKVLTDDDLLDEPDGSITVQVVDVSGQYKYVAGWSASATSDIRDNDEPVEVGISWIPNSFVDYVTEGNAGLFALTRTSGNGEMTVYGRVTQVGEFLDTATESGVEFLEDGTFRTTFQQGSLTRFVQVHTRENATPDEDGSITLELVARDGAGYLVDADSATATATVVDDDDPPTVTITADTGAITEGEQAVFTLTRTSSFRESLASPITVDLQVSQQGSFLAASGDLGPDIQGPVTVQVTFPSYTYTAELRLDTLDDNVPENVGELTVTVAPAPQGGYLVGDMAGAGVTVGDDELPRVTVRAVEAEVTEGEDAVFRFTRIGDGSRITVAMYVYGHDKIMTEETRAVANFDAPLILGNARVVFEPGETEKTLRLTTQQDNVNEGDGRLVVHPERFGAPTFRLEQPSRAEVLVKDDDIPTVSIPMPTLPEGMTLSEDGTTWEGSMIEGTEIRFGITCSPETYEFTEDRAHGLRHYFAWIQEMNHPAFYSHPQATHALNSMFMGAVGIFNCGDGLNTFLGNRNDRFVGPDGGEIRISILEGSPPSEALFLAEVERWRQALAESERTGTQTPLNQPGLFAVTSSRAYSGVIPCDDDIRFCARYEVGTVNAIKIKVLNRDPTILIKAESEAVNEGQPARFIVERHWNADNLAELQPPWSDTKALLRTSVEGRYITGMLPSEITFGQGETMKVLELATVGDSAFAEDGSVTVEVLPDTTGPDENVAAKYTKYEFYLGHTPEGGRSDQATVTIRNNDNQPGILISDARASESGTEMIFDVMLTNAWVPEVTLDWATSDGTATAGTDYTAGSGTITFPQGDTSTSRTITVAITADEDYEEDETFVITLSMPVGAGFPGGGTTATATGTIEDDDGLFLEVEVESGGPTNPVLPGETATVQFDVTNLGTRPTGAAVVIGNDLAGMDDCELGRIASGVTSRCTATFTSSVTGTFVVEATARDSETSTTSRTVTFTIVVGTVAEDDILPTAITLSADPDTVQEGDETTVTVTALLFAEPVDADPLDTDITVRVSIDNDTGEANAADGSDLESAIETFDIVIAAGDTTKSESFVLRTRGDDDDEEDETITLRGEFVPGDDNDVGVLPVTPVTLTITDDDTRGVTIAPLVIELDENGPGKFYTVVLDSAPADTVTVTAAPSGNPGLRVDPTELEFTRADWNRPRRVNVLAIEDGDAAANLSAGSISHQVAGGDYDSETAPDVSVQIAEATVPEITVTPARASEDSGELEFLVTLEPSLGQFVDVQYELVDGTAEAGSDYTRPVGGAQTLRIAAGHTEGAIRVAVTDDGLDEADEETFILRLTDISGDADLAGGGSTLDVQGTIEDNDPAPVASVAGPGGSLSFVSESVGTVTFTITLVGSTAEVVSVDYSTGNLSGGLSGRSGGIVNAVVVDDYTGVEGTIEFQPGETTKTITVDVTNDRTSEPVEYFAFNIGNPRNADLRQISARTAIIDNDRKRLVVTPIALTVEEEGTGASYTVKLATQPTGTVTVTLGGLADTEVSVDKTSLEFTTEDWDEEQEVEVSALADDDAVNDTVTLTHTLSGGDYEGLDADSVTVTVTDDDTAGLVLSEPTLTISEGSSATYTVKLASEPTDRVEVSLSVPPGADLSLGTARLIFTTENWREEQEVEVTTHPDDDAADDMASITHRPSGGDYGSAHNTDLPVIVTDPQTPDLIVSQVGITVEEGGEDGTSYTVKLATRPTDPVTVTITGQAGTDLSLDKTSLDFTENDWHEAQTVTVTADRDNNLTGESATLTHTAAGGDYDSVSKDLPVTVTDTTAQIVLSKTTITVEEEGEAAGYTVKLAALPTGPVTVTITGADNTHLSLDKTNLDFTVGNWNIEQEVSVSANHDADTSDDDFTLTHAAGGGGYDSAPEANLAVVVTDNDDGPAVTVSFGSGSYTVAEGGMVDVTVGLSANPERRVVILLSATDQDGASGVDYSGVRASVTFNSGETEKSFTINATDDTVDDDGESVKLSFGAMPAGVSAGTTSETTVSITDNDDPVVTVSFGSASYTVAEGGMVDVTVGLSANPERRVVILLTATDQDGASGVDYSGVPPSVTFNSGETEKSFTINATDDTVDDDGESVKLTFGAMPAGVSAGTTSETTVSITDNDDPVVTVSFGSASYTVAEGGMVDVTVGLSANPERRVVIQLTATDQDGASGVDYSGVPSSVTFNSGETEKSFTVNATDDTVDDDGESVKLGFGAMPAGVSAGTTSETTVSITDNDDPVVTVSFGSASYTVAEGGMVDVTVGLSANPERRVTIPISKTNQGGATGVDYSGVPSSVTFNSGETEKSFTVNATDDSVDDDGESVKLRFGAMPPGVNAGTNRETTVSITDNDDPAVTVSFGSAMYFATEGGDDAEVTVRLSSPAPRRVELPLTAVGHYKATPDDWRGVPEVLIFDTGETSKSFTVVAFDDTVEDDGETVELRFGALPDGFVAGTPGTTEVTLMNDDQAPEAVPTTEPDGLKDFATLCGDTRALLTIGQPFAGRIAFSDDIDAIRVEFTAGSNGYRVSLRDENNEQISAEDFYFGMVHPDDGWMRYVSYDYLTNWVTERDTFFLIPEKTGMYCVEIRAKSGGFTGNYRVLVDDAENPLASPVTGAESNSPDGDAIEGVPLDTGHFHRVSVGTPIAGEIEEAQDSDWYITRLGHGIYRVTVEGYGTGKGTLRVPGLRLRQSDTREFVPETADHTYVPIQNIDRYQSRWVAEFEIVGSSSGSDIFHFEVWSTQNTTGTYTMTLEKIDEFTYPQ